MSRKVGFAVVVLLVPMVLAAEEPASMDEESVERFVALAHQCVHQEYPHKIAHVMSSDKDVAPPRELTPAFYGCFDWHSRRKDWR